MQTDTTLDELEGISQNLTTEIAAQEWDNANITLRQLRTAIETLGHHIDTLGEDDDQHDILTGVFNAATEQHNETVDMLYDLGRYEGWRIGDTRPCGCPVEAGAIACPSCDQHHDQAMADCGECQFGVPVVWHDRHGCEDPK